jgi:hypothetical protein
MTFGKPFATLRLLPKSSNSKMFSLGIRQNPKNESEQEVK